MKDCSDDVKGFHQEEVTLHSDTQADLRGNRNANRDRLKRGLLKNEEPQPDEFIIQGSYAMRTMTQHPKNDYDIDDGASFRADKLVDGDGVPLTSFDAKQRVKKALLAGGGGPGKDPEIKENCVRVEYAAGHHVDIPVYRQTTGFLGKTKLELAGKDEWRDTNPREITDWFRDKEELTKVEGEDEPQLRRLVRLLKNYSRQNLDKDSLSGLILTILAEEKHRQHNAREDEAFRALLQSIKSRLQWNREVRNPANTAETLTKTIDGAKIDLLISQITGTLETLAPLDDYKCSKAEARSAWDKVFKTDFFGNLEDEDQARRVPYTPSPAEPSKPVYIRGPGTAA